MTSASSLAHGIKDLAAFSGELIQPSDARYDEVRALHNGLVDKRPALIARCGSTADIAAAVSIAQQRGVETAVRGGGLYNDGQFASLRDTLVYSNTATADGGGLFINIGGVISFTNSAVIANLAAQDGGLDPIRIGVFGDGQY